MSLAIKSATGLSRLFLNMIVDNRIPGIKSLCSMDLEHLFGFPATPPQEPDATTQAPSVDAGYLKNEAAAPLMMESIQIQPPHFTFRASTSALSEQWKIDCFPLEDSTLICADQLGRAFALNAHKCLGGTMTSLHNPKRMPISIFVPKPDADRRFDHNGFGSSLFVMERIPEPEVGCTARYSDQFEAYVICKPTVSSSLKTWKCQLLPPPPYLREPQYCRLSCPEISSYAVLDGGSQICISVDGVGTYCLDTENHTWSEFGKWTLPFRGKVEYVPELKLRFGFSAKDRHLAAADLSSISTMNSQPQLLELGKELDPPEEWKECKDSQLVNLGSGRLCIARFFRSRTLDGGFVGDESISDQDFAVFTGVEVVPRVLDASANADCSGNGGKGELRMTPHKSRCHTSNGTSIGAVF